MKNSNNYHDETAKENILQLRKLQEELPRFCRQYFRGIEQTTAPRTRLAYAYDLGVFFEFLHKNNSVLSKMDIIEFPLSVLDQITKADIEEYLEYLSYYVKDDGTEYTNDERGKRRKLASLRSFYNYFFRDEQIKSNPASLVPMPKLHDKEIVRLDPNEVAILLDQVEDGTKMTKSQMKFHDKTKVRDLALLTLLLGTGIRVSECVGLDISDVDFDNLAIKVRRKGGYEDVVYFGEEVEEALLSYLNGQCHEQCQHQQKDENADSAADLMSGTLGGNLQVCAVYLFFFCHTAPPLVHILAEDFADQLVQNIHDHKQNHTDRRGIAHFIADPAVVIGVVHNGVCLVIGTGEAHQIL